MAKVILGLTISLDGFAEDENGSISPLYKDLLRESDVMIDSILNTGSVVMSSDQLYIKIRIE